MLQRLRLWGTLIAIIVPGGLALVGLLVFVTVKLGADWLMKWVMGAAVLAVAVPSIFVAILHSHRQQDFETREPYRAPATACRQDAACYHR